VPAHAGREKFLAKQKNFTEDKLPCCWVFSEIKKIWPA
jgi:hypothetical protein